MMHFNDKNDVYYFLNYMTVTYRNYFHIDQIKNKNCE